MLGYRSAAPEVARQRAAVARAEGWRATRTKPLLLLRKALTDSSSLGSESGVQCLAKRGAEVGRRGSGQHDLVAFVEAGVASEGVR